MSKQVDERIVSMQFDNKRFESNVATTISSIDKLKDKLNFKGATKGLETIDAASKKVNMSYVINAVDTVGIKFNAMYSIADQALRDITNSAMNAGKKIISALTIPLSLSIVVSIIPLMLFSLILNHPRIKFFIL